MHAPQIIWIILMTLSLGIIIEKHGKVTTHNFWHVLIAVAIQVGLLYGEIFLDKAGDRRL